MCVGADARPDPIWQRTGAVRPPIPYHIPSSNKAQGAPRASRPEGSVSRRAQPIV